MTEVDESKFKAHPQCKRCVGTGKLGQSQCPCTEEAFFSRIQRGEIKACPACGAPLQEMGIGSIMECSSPNCCWNDELADFERMGWYTPPANWEWVGN